MFPSLSIGGQISCVASRRTAAGRSAVCFFRIDQRRALPGIVFGQQSLDRHFRETRVGVVAIQVGVGQLHGLDAIVQFHGRQWTAFVGRSVLMMFSISSAAMPCPLGGSS